MKDKILITEQRIEYIDIYRGIGILLMIMGHVTFGAYFDKFIHAFHVPIFFFISGFLFKKRTISVYEYIRRRLQTLIIPYFFFGVIHFVSAILTHCEIRIIWISNLLWENTVGMPVPGALWFLSAMFCADIIYYLMHKKIESIRLLSISSLIIMIFGILAIKIFPYKLPFAIDAGFVGIGIFHIGYLFQIYANQKWISYIMNMHRWKIMLVVIVDAIIIFINGNINMRTSMYSNFVLFIINVIISAIVLINIAKYIEKYSSKCKVLAVISRWLKEIGRESIVYLGINQIIIAMVVKSFQFLIIWSYVKNILILIVVLVLIKMFSLFLYKTRLKLFIGK